MFTFLVNVYWTSLKLELLVCNVVVLTQMYMGNILKSKYKSCVFLVMYTFAIIYISLQKIPILYYFPTQ